MEASTSSYLGKEPEDTAQQHESFASDTTGSFHTSFSDTSSKFETAPSSPVKQPTEERLSPRKSVVPKTIVPAIPKSFTPKKVVPKTLELQRNDPVADKPDRNTTERSIPEITVSEIEVETMQYVEQPSLEQQPNASMSPAPVHPLNLASVRRHISRSPEYTEVTRNAYIGEAGLSPSFDVPGMPSEIYADLVHNSVAVYIRGVPTEITSPELMRNLAGHHVLYDVCLVDLTAQQTFRWLIFQTWQDAKTFIENHYIVRATWRLGSKTLHSKVFACPALEPGYVFIGSPGIPTDGWEKNLFCKVLWEYRLDMETWNTQQALLNTVPSPPAPVAVKKEIGPKMPPIGTPRPPGWVPPVAAPDDILTEDLTTLSQPQPKQQVLGTEATKDPSPRNVDFGQAAVARVIAALSEVKLADDIATEEGPATTHAASGNSFVPQATTWAKLAQKAIGEEKSINIKTVVTKPTHPAPAPRLRTIGRIPVVEPQEKQMRLVVLWNLPQNITLTDVSNAIKEGPVFSIHFTNDPNTGQKSAAVVFQHAEQAREFQDALEQEKARGAPNRFKFIADSAVEVDTLIPMDEVMKKMGYPTYASRRLTIAKKGFFFIMKESHFRVFCEKVVAKEDIQLIWLYNGGNATAVFAKVIDAIKVKEALDKERDKADPNSHFYELQTSFSKDPCVQDINLSTDLHT